MDSKWLQFGIKTKSRGAWNCVRDIFNNNNKKPEEKENEIIFLVLFWNQQQQQQQKKPEAQRNT